MELDEDEVVDDDTDVVDDETAVVEDACDVVDEDDETVDEDADVEGADTDVDDDDALEVGVEAVDTLVAAADDDVDDVVDDEVVDPVDCDVVVCVDDDVVVLVDDVDELVLIPATPPVGVFEPWWVTRRIAVIPPASRARTISVHLKLRITVFSSWKCHQCFSFMLGTGCYRMVTAG